MSNNLNLQKNKLKLKQVERIKSYRYKISTFIKMNKSQVLQLVKFQAIYGRIEFNVLKVNINRRMKVMQVEINQLKLDNGLINI